MPRMRALYDLADVLMVNKLKNDIIDHMNTTLKTHGCVIGYGHLKTIKRDDLPQDKLYEMVFKYVAMRSSTFGFMIPSTGWSSQVREDNELGWDLLDAIDKHRSSPWPWPYDMEKCAFHDHGDGSKC